MSVDLQYKKDYVEKIAKEKGYSILTTVKEFYGDTIELEDCFGYRYCVKTKKLILTDMQKTRFSKYNKYSVYNIQKYLDLNSNGTILLSKEYTKNSDIYKFKCNCGRIFEKRLDNLIGRSSSCQFCSRSKGHIADIDYYGEVKRKCEELDYILLTNKIERLCDEFEYICKDHEDKGIQKSNYQYFINKGHSCIYCGRENFGKTRRTPIDELKKIADEKGFDFVDVDYTISCSPKVKLICRKHKDKGVQSIYITSLKKMKQCKYCNGYCRDKDDFQNLLDEKGLGLDVISYTEYKYNCIVKCRKCGYTWETRCYNLPSSNGCIKCSSSTYEKKAIDVLESFNLEYKFQYSFKDCYYKNNLVFDFYIPKYKIAIEIDGEGHDKPINFNGKGHKAAYKEFITQKIRDTIKDNYCIDKGIYMIRVPSKILKNGTDAIKVFIYDKIYKRIINLTNNSC